MPRVKTTSTSTISRISKTLFFLLVSLKFSKSQIKLQKPKRRAKESTSLSPQEREEYAKQINKEIDKLMEEMAGIENYMDKDLGGEINLLKMYSDISDRKKRKVKQKGENMQLDFSQIFDYLIKNEFKERQRDFLMCGLSLILDVWDDKNHRVFIEKVIESHGKKFDNIRGKIPFKICEIGSDKLTTLRHIFGSFFDPERFAFGKDNLKYASRLLIYFSNVRNQFFYSEILTLHTLANLFMIDLSVDFYNMENQLIHHYGKKQGDLFFNQIVNNQISKCSYAQYFKSKTGFSYNSLFVLEKLDYEYNGERNQNNTGLLKRTGYLEDFDIENLMFQEEINPKKSKFKGVVQYTLMKEKDKKVGFKIEEDNLLIKDYFWHLNYPISPETEYTHRKYDKLCLKCKQSILLIAQHVSKTVAEFQDYLDMEESEYIITERTKFYRENDEKKGDDQKKKENFYSQNNSDYFNLLHQMAENGNNDAALELAQEYYYGNDNAGIPRNEEMANRFYQQAAERGDAWATANFALMKFNSNLPFNVFF